MKKAYWYRLYPTQDQAALLQQQLDVAREVYNACLEERREAYRMCGVRLNYYSQAHQLKDVRRDRRDVAAVNFSLDKHRGHGPCDKGRLVMGERAVAACPLVRQHEEVD